jgi:outer membrane protein OmpA-like peptidoglycan-associated protein
MFDEEDRETGFALFLVIALAITVSIFTMGIAAGTAITQTGSKAAAAKAAIEPLTRVYFALGKADLPEDAVAALAPYARSAKAGRVVAVSGYHDASGDAAANAELAKQRAIAVRDALLGAGAPADRIELRKPALTTGDGDPREARRVEVTLQ